MDRTVTKVAYETIDKIRRLAEDEGATPGERAAARAKLAEYATALVVTDGKSTTWRDRVKARTLTVIKDEEARRVSIGLRTKEELRADAEREAEHKFRAEQIRMKHEHFKIDAEVELYDKLDRLNEARKKYTTKWGKV
jgi:hypothetical protein